MSLEDKVAMLEQEISELHETLASMGKNTRGTKDLFGRTFVVPVDAEHKATECNCSTLFVTANPHMRAFHTSWFGFFSSFYSTFAAASLVAYIKPDIGMNDAQWGYSGSAAVGGTIFFRFTMGWICDKFGARRGLGYLLLGTIPAIIGMMFVTGPAAFITLRCVIANATAAGWGNLGGGVTNLTMPFVFLLMMSFVNEDESKAWRLSYLVPLALHLIAGLTVLTARDLPDGNFKELEAVKAKQVSKSSTVLAVGCSNINAWIFTLTYGMCFGVELTMNNVAAKYFYTYQGFTPQISGICASCWGLMNLFARTVGGWISDYASARYGLRGRLWATWAVQTLEGVFCILLGVVTLGFHAPHESSVGDRVVPAYAFISSGADFDMMGSALRESEGYATGWTNLNATCYGQDGIDHSLLTIGACDTKNFKLNDAFRACLNLDPNLKTINLLRQTAPAEFGGPADLQCVSNANTAGPVMILVVFFSLCVQAAEGLHYGIVPYISRPALGVVSCMVGAGGNIGAFWTNMAFFTGYIRTDQGFINLGISVITITFLCSFMYFPEEGGMLVGKGGLGGYDPQIIKPPADYRGADQMDYAAAAKALEERKNSGTTTMKEIEVSNA